MRNFDDDLNKMQKVLRDNKFIEVLNVDRLYEHTNELLTEILSDFDFKDKEVLSVMASGDQPFSAYYLGAKNVDTFDINMATYYLFYLRKWYLLYYKKAFMNIHENNILSNAKSEELLESLEMVNQDCEEEVCVAKVWKEILKDNEFFSNSFYRNLIRNFSVPYIDNIPLLIERIKDKTANFSELDIFSDVGIDKKYDIIILSNILEYEHVTDPTNYYFKNNLDKLLKDDGVAICSVLNDMYFEIQLDQKRYFMDQLFERKISEKTFFDLAEKLDMPLYYTYRRK